MRKGIIRNRIVLAICIGVVLLAVVPFAGCPPVTIIPNEAPPVYLLQWGSPGIDPGQLAVPKGIAVDNNGKVYVADTFNNRIQQFTDNGVYLSTWGVWGSMPNQETQYPTGVAVDHVYNRVLVADTENNRIAYINGLMAFGSPGNGPLQFALPQSIAFDAAGNWYVADTFNNRIQKQNATTGDLTEWGTQGAGPGQFFHPSGVAVDTAGNVYVVDTNNNRIEKFTGNGVYLTQWGVTGGGPGQFDYPSGIAVDTAGNVYVADTVNNRIQKFTGNGAYLTQWGSYGSGNGQFSYPRGVAVDTANNVYVADTDNNRIQKFGKPFSPEKDTGAGKALAPTGAATPLPPGTIIVSTTLDGSPWVGAVNVSVTGPALFSIYSSPQNYGIMPLGTYNIAYTSNGPPNATFVNTTPSATQTLTTGGTTTFTLNFTTKPEIRTGTINVNAMLDGSPGTGAVSFTLTGPSPFSGTSVPLTSPNTSVGNYTLSYLSGGPSGASFVNITPSATQSLTAGGTTTFTLNFTTKPEVHTGTINVNAMLDGSPGAGVMSFTLTGPSPFSGTSVPLPLPNMPVGNYTLTYLSGGPSGASFINITPSATQSLTAGGTIIFTLNFITNGWCCKNGNLSQSTQADCARAGGTWYATQAQAIETCRPVMGWCCKDGRVYQSTQADCTKAGGTWYATQAQAIEACRLVLPKN